MELPPPPRRGEASTPVRYNPVPIGGPDRPPVNHSPGPGNIYASSSGRRDSYAAPRASSVRAGLASPYIKREPGQRHDSEYPSAPPSAVTDHSERSSTVYPEAGDDENKTEYVDGEPRKERQKRNKPTLSCFECVERKTKVGFFSSPRQGCRTFPCLHSLGHFDLSLLGHAAT